MAKEAKEFIILYKLSNNKDGEEFPQHIFITFSMEQVILQVGDCFQQAWKGCKKPMWFKVLSIDRPLNKVRVECHSFEGYTHEEEWDDLNLTEAAFIIGEYKMI